MRVIPQTIAQLKSQSPITDIVGQQVYADYPPQGVEAPFIVVTILSGQAHGTVTNCNVRAYSARMTVTIVADSRALAEQGIEAIEDALDGFSSTDATHPIQGTTVDGGLEWELLTPRDGSDQRSFLCEQDFQIHYRRN